MENIEVKKETKTSEKKTSLLKMVLLTLISLSVLFLAFVAYGAGVNNSLYKLILVTSDSMSPVFYSGDLIMIVKVDSDQVKVGDIVTFQTKNRELLTHRVVEIKEDGEFVTKGDANEEADVWSDGWKLKKVTTKYITRIPVIGHFIVWMKGLFVQGTGAWLKDTETLKANLAAGEWEAISATPVLSDSPEPIAPPESAESPELTAPLEPAAPLEPTAPPEPTVPPESTASPKPIETEEENE